MPNVERESELTFFQKRNKIQNGKSYKARLVKMNGESHRLRETRNLLQK